MDLNIKRHSYSHVLAQAVLKMFPEAKLAIGPAIEHGFYYDFDLPRTLIPEDLALIEESMREIIKSKAKFSRYEEPTDKAKEFLRKIKQDYKVELVEDLEKDNVTQVSFYKTGEHFVDLCAGPHVENTGELNPEAFRLHKIAGAYWRGDEKRPQLQRIYGLAFETKKQLEDYLHQLAEAEKRDHRKLGKELDLFSISEDIGQGLILWMPKGAMLRKVVMDFILDTYLKHDYEPVFTPHMASVKLWEKSGHWNFYRESMYQPFGIEEEEYTLKPMNCPFHVTMYNMKKHSYRDLPKRWTELGTVYRYEKSGVLHGLVRVRGFTQDDAHIICTPEQLPQELHAMLELSRYVLTTFGFTEFEVNLSTRDPENKDKYLGDDEAWNGAENTLKEALKNVGWDHYVEDVGGAVFYGPKIDLKIKDALNRPWQLSTFQVDFNLPLRFDMSYVGTDGQPHRPRMIHRALLGSLERFIGVLIEHYGGAFPVWLAPVQARILPISEKSLDYAEKVYKSLRKNDIRVEMDRGEDTLNYKIRKAELEKIPYMLIVGEKEAKEGTVAVRNYKTKGQEVSKVEEWEKLLLEEIREKK